MKQKKKVAIIISSNNPGQLLIDCLISLKRTSYKNYKIFLVNDSGKPLTVIFSESIEIIHTDGNTGFSKAYNKGIIKSLDCDPDYFLLLSLSHCLGRERDFGKSILDYKTTLRTRACR